MRNADATPSPACRSYQHISSGPSPMESLTRDGVRGDGPNGRDTVDAWSVLIGGSFLECCEQATPGRLGSNQRSCPERGIGHSRERGEPRFLLFVRRFPGATPFISRFSVPDRPEGPPPMAVAAAAKSGIGARRRVAVASPGDAPSARPSSHGARPMAADRGDCRRGVESVDRWAVRRRRRCSPGRASGTTDHPSASGRDPDDACRA